MPRPEPNPDPDGVWPSCDDEPPGVSIRPLRHADLAALLAHLDQHDRRKDPGDTLRQGLPAPVVAVRVRPSVGRPGASAQAEYRRRRATERASWTRTIPWRMAAVLAAGLAAGLLAALLVPRLAGPAGLLAAASVAWRLWVPPKLRLPRLAARRRRRTAHRAPARPPGAAGVGGPARPGHPRLAANIDCLAIGPGGVVVIDTKEYRGRLHLDRYGFLWHGHHLLISNLRRVRWEADQADEVLGIADVHVAAIMAVHGASVPWGCLEADGVTVVPAGRVPDLLRALPSVLGPERVAWLADRARLRFCAAA
jgi:hypothetical protein